MKKIIALLRNECAEQSKTALEKRGIHSVIVLPVRTKFRSPQTVSYPESSLHREDAGCLRQKPDDNRENAPRLVYPDNFDHEPEWDFFPKTLFVIIVSDDVVHHVVHELIEMNQHGDREDGKIFVCPMVSAIEIGNGECGDNALS